MNSSMPADSKEKSNLEQQALRAISFLSAEEQKKVLEYILSLINLQKVKNDERSSQ